eukprot:5385114-Alexandrium_andersonii.AAC.1
MSRGFAGPSVMPLVGRLLSMNRWPFRGAGAIAIRVDGCSHHLAVDVHSGLFLGSAASLRA